MGSKSLLVIAGVAVITLLSLIFLAATYDPPEGTTTIVVPPPAPPVQPVVREVPSSPVIEPPPVAVETPVAEPEVVEPEPVEVIELPALGDSDSFVLARLRDLQNGAALIRMLADDQLIRRFVIFVDNVSRGELPETNLPYRPMQQEMMVRNIDDNLFVMEEQAFRRFDQVVDAFTTVDADQAMSLYRIAAPLFQQAYLELGYRDANFEPVLRRALTRVVQADEVEGNLQMIKPAVMYLYADSALEGMTDVDKLLVRLGPQNREKLRVQLTEFLSLL